MMDAPVACRPELRSLAPHSITYATEDIPIVLFGDFLTLWCLLMVYNEYPTRALNPTSIKCYLPSTDAIDRREKFTDAYEVLRSAHASALN